MSASELAKFLDALVRDPLLFPLYNTAGYLLKTFCNIGAKRNSTGEDFREFNTEGLLADDMGDIMKRNACGKWKLMSGAEATLWALQGRRSMGFMSSKQMGQEHGHIVRVYPKNMDLSGSLKHPVPWCANIGPGDPGKPLINVSMTAKTRPNWICKTSQAFPVSCGECLYYGWLG